MQATRWQPRYQPSLSPTTGRHSPTARHAATHRPPTRSPKPPDPGLARAPAASIDAAKDLTKRTGPCPGASSRRTRGAVGGQGALPQICFVMRNLSDGSEQQIIWGIIWGIGGKGREGARCCPCIRRRRRRRRRPVTNVLQQDAAETPTHIILQPRYGRRRRRSNSGRSSSSTDVWAGGRSVGTDGRARSSGSRLTTNVASLNSTRCKLSLLRRRRPALPCS